MEKIYIVGADRAAGKMDIFCFCIGKNERFSEILPSFWNKEFEGTKEECQRYIEEEIKNTTRYVVFETQDGHYYYIKMDCTTGSYQENACSCYDDCVAEFETEEEARNYCIL